MAPTYILAIDGGGTKVVAELKELATGKQFRAQAGSASLSNDLDLAVENIVKVTREVCEQSNAKPSDMVTVMGLAGGSSVSLAEQVKVMLKLIYEIEFAYLEITSDATTSLYGANLGAPCVVVALGTGAVGARLTAQNQIKLVGGWGFTVDDFGGGARIGLMAVQHLLNDIDSFDLPKSPLTIRLSEQLGCTRQAISDWLKLAKPADYAAFSPLVFSLQDECKVAKSVLAEHTQSVVELISKSRGNSPLPVILIGGLAKVSQPLLPQALQNELSPCKGDSLTGASILAAKHYYDIIEEGQPNEP
ncbi:BadF/BadG/BcrA/BcrD ATPase family protein [Pseudoalteromonas sp. Ps84H-4]|jgi:glucosamine kinase|uniref:BadF/BadG/BcrA/BcrD ATPase family protein n=1 Tax=Pseudoalteromonas sp. Ps84H-4 TaxID=2954502 RepID=UPI0020979414|nr:BadF/BadG/BcrA/BcrD ATPase family protein [Pseudoalteromonas sp. Ps84H-4]MCO7250026.1 ATPase [Pseudoalteromonas sp. Ps84H-4]